MKSSIFVEAVTEAITEGILVLLEQVVIVITGLMRLCLGGQQEPQESEEIEGLDEKNLFLLVRRGGEDEEG